MMALLARIGSSTENASANQAQYGTTLHPSEQPCKNASSRLFHIIYSSPNGCQPSLFSSYQAPFLFQSHMEKWNINDYHAEIYKDEKSLRSGRKDVENIQRECDYNCFTSKQKTKAAQILQELNSVSKNFALYNPYLFKL